MNRLKAIMFLVLLTGLVSMVFNSGCSQRICEYDPTTGVWRYKSNSLATDSQADRVIIKTPSGIVVEIDKAVQDNDSGKVITPYGVVETEK